MHAHVSGEIAGCFSEAALPKHVTHSLSLSITSHHHPLQSSEVEHEGGGVWGGDCPLVDSDCGQHGTRTEEAPNGRQSPFEKNTKSYHNGLKRRQALLARSKMVREGGSSRERGRGRDGAVDCWTECECAVILLL